ncbi:glycosyltransferase family 2 protein, partial [Streptosporangium canum]|uniref:glycosyltransferase family 2 protein n=1 Tax=Streptosporangium canum TaxID=324952 RepID=UPI003415886A
MEGREAEEVIDGSITRPMRRPASSPAPLPGGDRPVRPRGPEGPGEPHDPGDPAAVPGKSEDLAGAADSEETGHLGKTAGADPPEEADDSPTMLVRRVRPGAAEETADSEIADDTTTAPPPVEDISAVITWRVPMRDEAPPVGKAAGPSLSVVIVGGSPGSRARLPVIVEALRAQRPAPEEIVLVVEDGPELVAWAEATLDGVVVVHNQEVAGAAAARNLGLASARGDVVAFLDDDSSPCPGWTESLLAPYADDDVIGVRGRVAVRWSTGKPDWFPAELAWVLGVPCTGSPAEPGQIDDLYGGALSFRREVLAEAGGFPEDADGFPERPGRRPGVVAGPAGGAATELRSRLRKLRPDAKLLHQPSAIVRLDVPAHRARLSYFLARCAAEGRSQAGVPQRAGGREGLSAHLAPVRKGLPRAVFRAVTFTGPADVKGWKALLVMLLGLAAAGVGYAAERLRATRTDGTA